MATEMRMTSKKTPDNGGEERGTSPGVPSEATVHPDGPLFASAQAEAVGAPEPSSPYPWDEPGESGGDAEVSSEPDPHDELPEAKEFFGPAADQSAAAGEDPESGLQRLNESIEQLLETVDAVAADVAVSRSHLERKAGTGPSDRSPETADSEIEDRIRVHTADFHRWIETDRRRRRWWPAVAAGIAAPAALLLGLLVEQQYQVIPLHDPTGGWRGHIWEQYGRRIVDCAVEARRTGADVDCPLTVRKP